MTLAYQIGFALLVLATIGTVVGLGSPRTYRDRGLGWVLVGMAWSGLLFDGLLALAIFGMASGRWAAYALLVFLYVRVPVQTALFWIIVKSRKRRS